MATCGIYKITNQYNQKCYIGQSVNIEHRWRQHRRAVNKTESDTYDYPLYRAIRKYGIENFSFEIIEECSFSEQDEREIYYINHYNSILYGYNISTGGSHGVVYKKLSHDKILEIHKVLKSTSLSFDEIALMFGVSARTIRAINIGTSSHIDNTSYPIRSKQSKRIVSGICSCCGCKTSGYSNQCQPCSQRRIQNRPNPDDLKEMILIYGFEGVGRRYGLSGNAVKKWCKAYGMPHRKKELRM